MNTTKNSSGNNKQDRRAHDFRHVSNIGGAITDEEFADEFLAYPANPNGQDAKFQFNFLGAELEKVSAAKNVRNELTKGQP